LKKPDGAFEQVGKGQFKLRASAGRARHELAPRQAVESFAHHV
jgi:hypothetical protein